MTPQAEIGPDGTLRFGIPRGLPAGPAEVVVVVQPGRPAPTAGPEIPAPDPGGRSGLFVGRGRPSADIAPILEEVEAAWKAKLADLHP